MVETLYASCSRYPARAVNRITVHRHGELAWVQRGEGAFELAGRRHETPSGSLVLIPPNIEHREWAGKSGFKVLYLGLLAKEALPGPRVLAAPSAALLYPLSAIAAELLSDAPDREEALALWANLVVLKLRRELSESPATADREVRPPGAAARDPALLASAIRDLRPPGRAVGTPAEEQVEDAVRFLKENLSGSHDLSTLSRRYSLNPGYFSAVFKKQTGSPPKRFLNELRIDMARKLLLDPDCTVAKAAELVGIEDAFYFSRLFKKRAGVSPSEYRDEVLGKPRRR